MSVHRGILSLVLVGATSLCGNVRADVRPTVNDLYLIPINGIATGTVTATSADSWSDLEFVSFVPEFGAEPGSPSPIYYPPQWNKNAQLFYWDATGSSEGDFTWRVYGYTQSFSDSGLIVVDNSLYGRAPEINDLHFVVESPASNGGVVSGLVTASDSEAQWSELLYPSYSPYAGGPHTEPMGIIDPEWNPSTQQFTWEMAGAAPGIYTWHVHASLVDGSRNAGAIVVEIQVPEPGAFGLLLIALMTAPLAIRRRASKPGRLS